MRRILAALTAGTLLFLGGAALADVNDPGSGCNDQVNGTSCVPDPSEEGQDCLPHGNNEDGNENHCTITPTTVSGTTTPPVTESTTTPVTTVSEAPPTTPSPPSEVTTTTQPTVPPSDTTSTETPSNGGSPPEGPSNGPSKLAFTGVEDIVPLGALAIALLSLGTLLMWRGSRKE